MTDNITCDIAIVGAGIAGLWTANILAQKGYHVLVLEKEAVGAGQTIRSQGIIHGGTKYALKGRLTQAALGISQMPALWQACLSGQGEIDLSAVQTLSDAHYLWTRGKFTAAIKGFISQKMLSSNSQVLPSEEYPVFFQQKAFQGALCALSETVLEIRSLLVALAEPIKNQILHGTATAQYTADNQIDHLLLQHSDQTTEVRAQQYIFTAGQGGQHLLPNASKHMQLRPLHMAWLRFPEYRPNQHIYVHCVEQGTTPKLTVTSHIDQHHRTVWYLGGGLAETGVERSTAEQIHTARNLAHTLFPWVDFTNCQWFTDRIERAEAKQPGNARPDGPYAEKIAENAIIAWPTKLALAPLLADKIQKLLPAMTNKTPHSIADWPTAPIGTYLWDQ